MPASDISKLPAHLRTDALNRFSANANAPGGAKRQTNGPVQPFGRAQQAALQRLAGTMGIYVIETNQTGPLAFSIGGAVPASITVESGTPATVSVVAGVSPAPPPLVPVTWAAGGARSLTNQVLDGTLVTQGGNAKVVVG